MVGTPGFFPYCCSDLNCTLKWPSYSQRITTIPVKPKHFFGNTRFTGCSTTKTVGRGELRSGFFADWFLNRPSFGQTTRFKIFKKIMLQFTAGWTMGALKKTIDLFRNNHRRKDCPVCCRQIGQFFSIDHDCRGGFVGQWIHLFHFFGGCF